MTRLCRSWCRWSIQCKTSYVEERQISSRREEGRAQQGGFLTIEKFCKYFDRPVSYYVDVDYSIDDEEKISSPTEVSHLRELLQMQKQLLDAKDEQIALLKAQLSKQKVQLELK